MMSETKKPFVITDRRKFTTEGELRPDAEVTPRERESRSEAPVAEMPAPQAVQAEPAATPASAGSEVTGDATYEGELPAPTAEQTAQSKRAYEQTADRLETAIRATNPGMEHPPAMNFEQLVQSVYMTAIMQLGGATQEGEQPRVDLLGARASIDMMGVLAEKTKGNLSATEQKYIDSALFELRMAFLEMTQALARSAQVRGGAAGPGATGGAGAAGAPTLVR